MKIKAQKKLSLHKETVATLQQHDLREAVGGTSGQYTCNLTLGCTAGCPSFTCPTVYCPTQLCTYIGC